MGQELLKTDIISERFRKYLIKAIFNRKEFYVLSGADLSDGEIDKILISESKAVLFFSDIHQLRNYILYSNKISIFDYENTKSWAINYKSKKEYLQINFDSLSYIINNSGLIESEELNFINSINFITDYAYQTENKYLLKLLSSNEIIDFKDVIVDKYIWKSVNEPRVKIESTGSKRFFQAIEQVINYFYQHISIIK